MARTIQQCMVDLWTQLTTHAADEVAATIADEAGDAVIFGLAHGMVNDAEGSPNSFDETNIVGDFSTFSSIAFVNDGPAQSVLIGGWYDTRPTIAGGATALTTQMKARINGGSWLPVSSSNAHYASSNELSHPIHRALSIPTGNVTVEFRAEVTFTSGMVAGDTVEISQSRRTVTWVQPS